jgi:hypothetical protein
MLAALAEQCEFLAPLAGRGPRAPNENRNSAR